MSPRPVRRPEVQRPDLGGPFPEHLAVIMDGNGRWARQQGLLRIQGHTAGVDSVREITTSCAGMGVKSLTLYAFSVENWSRPSTEVTYLMRLLRIFLRGERSTLMRNSVRLRCIGRLDDLPRGALKALRRTEDLTAGNDGMVLRLALSYGSRSELADGLKRALEDARAGRLDPEQVDDETLRSYLYDPSTPDPDLIVRTAGEMRLSNFLLWQASYSELYVTEACWPEFREPQLLEAMRAYAQRKRRFGGLLAGERDGESGAQAQPADDPSASSSTRSSRGHA